MAFEGGQIKIVGALAAADQSSAQYKFVTKNTTNNQFAVAAVDGAVVAGVTQGKAGAAGRAAEIVCFGITKIWAGGTLAAGDYVGTDNAGKAVKKNLTSTGADVGDFICGYVMEGCASGELATIFFQPMYRVFAS